MKENFEIPINTIPEDNQPQETNPNESRKLLDHALQYGTLEDLEKLFDEGMDINQTDFQDRTALQLMSFRGNEKAVTMLINRGADVNRFFMFKDTIPMSALDAAQQGRKTEIINILIAHGAKTGAELQSN